MKEIQLHKTILLPLYFVALTDASGGFVSNFRRGTGHMFSPGALDDFLARNALSHVIRAHEVKEAGFQVNGVKFKYL